MTRVRRSHPPALAKLVERTLRTECRLPEGTRILLGVSGGGDSQALLWVLAHLRSRLPFELLAHGVDHGLRPEAGAELDLAEALARSLGVPFRRSRVSLERGGNLMARARDARYRELRGVLDSLGGGLIATAHHADDRAETVLLRLLRGAGPRGLGVLPPLSEGLVRPMIRARRTDVQAHLARHRILFASDPSNEDPRRARTRVRKELVPLLESMSPRIVEHLNALADQLAGAKGPELGGEPLGRAQAQALERLLASGRGQIWLPRGRLARLCPATGAPEISGAVGPGAVKRRQK